MVATVNLSFADVAAPKCEARSRFEESAKVGAAEALFLSMESAWFSNVLKLGHPKRHKMYT